MEDKIRLIDEIVQLHPSYGVNIGWAEYTGGMKDSGSWFFRKMLDVPIAELYEFYGNYLNDVENYKLEVLSDEDLALQKDIVTLGDGFGWSNRLEQKRRREVNDNIERRMLFGNVEK